MSTTKVNPAKASQVKELQELLSKSRSVAIVDYKGLKVSQVTQLRQAVRKAGGLMLVTKNTLFKIATGNSDLNLSGTSAFIFSLTDEVAAPKAVAEFATKNNLPTFKAGFLNDRLLTASEISDLSTLPDKPTLVAKLLGSLNSPIFSLAYNLNWNLSKLVRTLDAVAKSKA